MDHMKSQNHEQPKALSDVEFEAALYAVLRDEGNFFPQTEEDVALLKANQDMNGVPTPDTQKFRQLLRQAAQEKYVKIKDAKTSGHLFSATVEKLNTLLNRNWVASPDIDANLASLAGVARNGGTISDEIRKRMNSDRSQAQEQAKKRNDTH
jgi:hypothetical protein